MGELAEKPSASRNEIPHKGGGKQLGPLMGKKQEYAERWQMARALCNFPQLVLELGVPPKKIGAQGGLDWKECAVYVNPDFAEKLAQESGREETKIALGLMLQGILCYTVFPFSLERAALARKMAQDCAREGEGEGFRELVFSTFTEIANAAYCALDPGMSGAAVELQEALATEPDERRGRLRKLILAYVKTQAGEIADVEPGFAPHFARMLSIDFANAPLDRQALREGISLWADVLRQLGFGQEGTAQPLLIGGEGKPPSGESSLNELKNLGIGKVREMLEALASEVSSDEFKRIRTMLRGMQEGKDWEGEKGWQSSIGIGTSSGELRIDMALIEFYLAIAGRYPWHIEKRLKDGSGSRRSLGKVGTHNVGDDPGLAQPWDSFGEIVPGFTRAMKSVMKPKKTDEHAVSDLIIIIDSSGTMLDPAEQKSPMVAAAYCAALAYSRLGAKVGVVNFSGETFFLQPTYDLYSSLGAIVAYQGGGTRLDIGLVRKLVDGIEPGLGKMHSGQNLEDLLRRKRFAGIRESATLKDLALARRDIEPVLGEAPVDVMLFSDLKVSNLKEILGMCESHAGVRNVSILSNAKAPKEAYGFGKAVIADGLAEFDDLVNASVRLARRAAEGGG